jgi:hypothetical protein
MQTNGEVRRRGQIVVLVVVLSAIVLIAANTAHALEMGGAGGPSTVATGTVETVACPVTACNDPSLSAAVVQDGQPFSYAVQIALVNG